MVANDDDVKAEGIKVLTDNSFEFNKEISFKIFIGLPNQDVENYTVLFFVDNEQAPLFHKGKKFTAFSSRPEFNSFVVDVNITDLIKNTHYCFALLLLNDENANYETIYTSNMVRLSTIRFPK